MGRLADVMQAGSSSDSGKAETGGNEAVTIVKDEAIATSLSNQKTQCCLREGYCFGLIKIQFILELTLNIRPK